MAGSAVHVEDPEEEVVIALVALTGAPEQPLRVPGRKVRIQHRLTAQHPACNNTYTLSDKHDNITSTEQTH